MGCASSLPTLLLDQMARSDASRPSNLASACLGTRSPEVSVTSKPDSNAPVWPPSPPNYLLEAWYLAEVEAIEAC